MHTSVCMHMSHAPRLRPRSVHPSGALRFSEAGATIRVAPLTLEGPIQLDATRSSKLRAVRFNKAGAAMSKHRLSTWASDFICLPGQFCELAVFAVPLGSLRVADEDSAGPPPRAGRRARVITLIRHPPQQRKDARILRVDATSCTATRPPSGVRHSEHVPAPVELVYTVTRAAVAPIGVGR